MSNHIATLLYVQSMFSRLYKISVLFLLHKIFSVRLSLFFLFFFYQNIHIKIRSIRNQININHPLYWFDTSVQYYVRRYIIIFNQTLMIKTAIFKAITNIQHILVEVLPFYIPHTIHVVVNKISNFWMFHVLQGTVHFGLSRKNELTNTKKDKQITPFGC